MMIKKISILALLFVFILSYSQKIVNDFNGDNIKDNLSYKCYKVDEIKGITEPTCELILSLKGKSNKSFKFYLPYVGDPIITDCGKGCISLFDSSKDTEYLSEYTYIKKYNDWILTKNETMYSNGKVENDIPKKYKLGISGKKYLLIKRK